MKIKLQLFFISMAIVVTLVHIAYMLLVSGAGFITSYLLDFHISVIDHTALEPFRYRLLSEWIFHPFLLFAGPQNFFGLAAGFSFIQRATIFFLLFRYLRQLGFSVNLSIAGVLLLAFGMLFAFHEAGFSFYTYTEIIIFLLAALLIQQGLPYWIILLAGLAALNREASILLPSLLLAEILEFTPMPHLRKNPAYLLPAVASLAVFVATYGLLRLSIGPGGYWGITGIGAVLNNLQDPRTYLGLLGMFHVLLIVPFFIHKLPRRLQSLFILLALPWFAAQFWFGTTDEARLFLLPLTMVLIPSGLWLWQTYSFHLKHRFIS